jgi:hypothetical protein
VISLLPPSDSLSSAISDLICADNRAWRDIKEFECGHGFYRKIERLGGVGSGFALRGSRLAASFGVKASRSFPLPASLRYSFAISRRSASEVCIFNVPPENERVQGRPGARCTRGPVCQAHKRKRTRAYRFSGEHPAFPAQCLYGLYRALLGETALLPPSPPRSLLLENLTPASGVRTTRLCRTFEPRSSVAALASTASPRPFVTIASRPSCRVGWRRL